MSYNYNYFAHCGETPNAAIPINTVLIVFIDLNKKVLMVIPWNEKNYNKVNINKDVDKQ